MELAQDKIDLIEKIIKNDRKFANNEDLYDDFFNETCKRSLVIVKTITSDATLEAYLRKIATTSILNVLKDSGRLRRSRNGFMPTHEVSLEMAAGSPSLDYSDVKIVYDTADIADSPEDLVLQKEVVTRVISALDKINEAEPDKQFLNIYKLRYENGMTQKEIAEELNLSQSEVSKRLFKLMEKVKQFFN